ncbi:MAG: hypothetical protein ABGY71_08900 [bacterium]|jgi:hypothetical protein
MPSKTLLIAFFLACACAGPGAGPASDAAAVTLRVAGFVEAAGIT